ncbi:PAS domain-containing protein, partial [candidate division KSB1 bacterium]
ANYTSPGLSMDDVIGKPLYAFVDKSNQVRVKKVLEKAIKTAQSVSYETEYLTPEGETIYYESRAVPRIVDKKVTGILLSARDLTKFKRTEREHYERIKELDGLYGLGRLSESTEDLEHLFNEFLKSVVPKSMGYPEAVCSKIELDGKEYCDESGTCQKFLSAFINVRGEKRGKLQIGYVEDLPFLKDFEQKLVDGYAERLGRIIDRIESKEALRRSEGRYLLAQSSANIGSWEWDMVSGDLFWSDTIEPMFGFEEGKFGKTYEAFLECVHPDDREYVIKSVDKCVRKNKDYDIEHRIIWPDKTLRWVSETGDVTRDEEGNAVRMVGIVQDITGKKNAEHLLKKAHDEMELRVLERTAELAKTNIELQKEVQEHKKTAKELEESREQLRNFSSYLQTAREEERTRISREIHDDLGQALTALKMDIVWLKRKIPETEEDLFEKSDSMSDLIDNTIKTVQRISSELRPGILDDLGLTSAIEWQISEFEKRTGIKCKFKCTFDSEYLDTALATDIFRIFQEALTNIIRHAKATKVNVDISDKSGDLILKVRDNGKGITDTKIKDRKSLGLTGINERVLPWRGNFKISGGKNKGTSVLVTIPDIKNWEKK